MWFRFYTEALDDPKVQRLDPVLFKAWVNLLCLAKKNDGILGSIEAIAFALRETEETVSSWIKTLSELGLFDSKKNTWEPHNWRKRQYKSDSSTDRVKRFRERTKDVSRNAPETETETETDKKEGAGAPAGKDYGFVGKLGRITSEQLNQWRKAYVHVPDIVAEIQAADDYYAAHPPKPDAKYFWLYSSWLKRTNDQRADKAKPAPLSKTALENAKHRAWNHATPEEWDRLMTAGPGELELKH